MDDGPGRNQYRFLHRVNAARKPIMARKPDPRTGLNQILEMKDLVMDPGSPSSPSSSSVHPELQGGSPPSGQTPWCFPQLGSAVPVFNEVSVKFAERASLFGRQIAGFVEEAVLSEARLDEGENSRSSAAQGASVRCNNAGAAAGSGSSDMEQQLTAVTLQSGRESVDTASQSDTLLGLPNFGGAISLFNATSAVMMGMGQTLMTGPPAVWQGSVTCVRPFLISFHPCDRVEVKTRGNPCSTTSPSLSRFGIELIGTKLAWRVSCPCMRFIQMRLRCARARLKSLVSRVQTTLRGSGDDIGWLQKDPNLPPVVDKTVRFVQLLGRISNGVHILPDTLVYLLIPGLFSNHGPLYFVDTKKYFSKLGLPCYIARIHSEAGVETNARELKEYIEELYWGTGKRVVLLGHSKGGVDAAAACAMYWPELKDKVVGLVFAQSPYGGSPVASDILREGQIADFETRRLLEVIITRVIKGDMQSLEDLTYDKRREFLAKYPLPTDLLTVSFHTEASRAASVLSTMSHIAHAELPWLPGTSSTPTSEDPAASTKLPVVIPLAAAMALCALHLDLRYGEKSDGLVARKDAEIPGSLVVRPDKKLDHAWMVYSPSRKEANDPDSSQMCEALITLLLEEEACRKASLSNGDGKALGENSRISEYFTPDTQSQEIEVGQDYLEKL